MSALHWFAPFRLNMDARDDICKPRDLFPYTGMYTIDGLLNHRLDVTWDAFRHLVMPVITLSLYHWATLGRIIRSTIIIERRKEYIIAAKGTRRERKHDYVETCFSEHVDTHHLPVWRFPAASLVTGVFVVEIIYLIFGNFRSDLEIHDGDSRSCSGFGVCSL